MRVRVLGVILLAALPLVGCAKNTASTASTASTTSMTSQAAAAMGSVAELSKSPLITSLTSGLGVNATQAIAGGGAMLGIASETLSGQDWNKIAAAIPQANALISQSKTLTGITGKIGSLTNVSSHLTKLGLTQDQVTAMKPLMTDFVSTAAGADVGRLFDSAVH